MATLDGVLATAASAFLPVGAGAIVVHQDITGEYAISVRYGGAEQAQQPMRRFATLPELKALLSSGAIPGVRGDENGWAPLPPQADQKPKTARPTMIVDATPTAATATTTTATPAAVPAAANSPARSAGDATDAFKRQLRDAFEAIALGQTFEFRRTFTEGDVALFCGVTGDYNPYHIDESFAQETWFGRRIVPGLLTGSMLTHIGGMIGFLAQEMSFQYVAPVYIGDTITCTVTFIAKDAEQRLLTGSARCLNQDGAEVLRGTFNGFPAQVRLAR
ncbi:MAG: MaoC family protein [Ktedonobacterales bacterium]|nr:MAG: MaoC family protein [Ktedonobacterales bacterium]